MNLDQWEKRDGEGKDEGAMVVALRSSEAGEGEVGSDTCRRCLTIQKWSLPNKPRRASQRVVTLPDRGAIPSVSSRLAPWAMLMVVRVPASCCVAA